MEAVNRMIKPIFVCTIVLLCLIGFFFFFKYALLKILGLLLLIGVFLIGSYLVFCILFEVIGCLAVLALPLIVILIVIGAFVYFM
ncbi:hypothetical protein [Priestia endophytica]|uniref:hypothetical protein n=1 Tax=Priestia endophytica TaxID=135735 RepID=UPI00124E0580|nr:hypothetical protein [Priestia endophytica]KAB2489613.1 hypothetical protein F8155_23030 [Priestia endophytica]